jgi:serine/threonine protein kinase
MSSEDRLESLLSRWWLLRRQGVDVSVDELCHDCPDLIAPLRQRIDRFNSQATPMPSAFSTEAPLPPAPGYVDESAPTVVMRRAVAEGAPPSEAQATNPPSPSPPALVPGYEVLGVLGRGGMGIVYKARQVKLNRVVALKMILHGDHVGASQHARFLAEAEAIAAVKHPGIVQVFDFGTHEGLPYFALEFCSGGSLAQRLAGKPLPPREAARLVEQVARAVQAAHGAGIVHRDLKPGNVLLSAAVPPPACGLAVPTSDAATAKPQVGLDGVDPKITDFGLARRIEGGIRLSQTGTVMGTPSYMAPEQARGEKAVGPAADVYSLGAILYECLTGRPPFLAGTPLETMRQVLADEPLLPRSLNPEVPADLQTVALKCLHKGPAQRYGSAAALADDLKRWLDGEPVLARPVGPGGRLWRWARRNPRVAPLLMALVLIVSGVLAGLAALWLRAENQLHEASEQRAQAEQNLEEARNKQERADRHLALQKELLNSYSNLNVLQTTSNQPAEAIQSARRTCVLLEQLVALEPDNLEYQSAWGGALHTLAVALEKLGRHAEALAAYRQAIEHQKVAFARAPKGPNHREWLSNHHYCAGRVLRDLGRLADAVAAFQECRALWVTEPRRLYQMAQDIAQCAARVGQGNANLTEADQAERRRYADQAVETLQQAVTHGFKDIQHLQTNKALDVLRSHAGFQKLVGELQAKAMKK